MENDMKYFSLFLIMDVDITGFMKTNLKIHLKSSFDTSFQI